MKPLDEASEAVVRTLGLDDAAIARRKAFLEFTDDDAERLKALHAVLRDLGPDFVNAFYSHLLTFEETRRFISDPQSLDRLNRTQAAYFDSLTAGDYGREYILHRLRVGIVHQRIGLAPQWYLGAYSKYLVRLLPEIWQRLGKDPEAFVAAAQSLIKIVLLDMGLAIDTYIHADRQTILKLKEYAESVFAAIPDGLVVLSSELTILSANRTFLKRFGLTAQTIRGRRLMEVIAADGLRERALEVLANGTAQHDLPFSMGVVESGERKPVRVTLMGIHLAEEEEEEEEEARLLLIVEDLTEEQRLRAQAHAHEMRFHDLVQGLDAIVWEADAATFAFTFVSRRAEAILCYPLDRWLGEPDFWANVIHPEDREQTLALYREAAAKGRDHTLEYRAVAADGSVVWLQDLVHLVRGKEGQAQQLRGVMLDISEQKAQAARIEQFAFYDPLTGLPNRALFLDRLKQALASAQRHGQQAALLFLDIDRFKEINDTLGHNIGDQVLTEVARRFQTSLRGEDTLARLGGDEFVIIASGADQAATAVIAERLQQVLVQPFEVDGNVFSLNASIGLALCPEDGVTPEDLLKHADIAMYRAKTNGSGYRFYRPEMGAELARRLELVRRLNQALAAGQLQLHYQPQVHLQTGDMTGAEALVRWNDPEWGPVPPAEFIPVAEERGMIGAIGEWVLAEACRQMKAWREAGLAFPGRLSVNVAAQQLGDPKFPAKAREIVEAAELAPNMFELELTESGMMANPERAIAAVQELKTAGFALAIDDFGTGYSSLVYLKRFAADKLKIDISFVRDMLTDRNDYTIVSTIIGMARSLDLKTLAEGVEDAAQAQSLLALGCDLAQGYHFGHPEPADAFAKAWLRSNGSE